MIKLGARSLVAFMGSMNAMPMAYAYSLKRAGYDCIYFVDAAKSNALCRPESFYPDINYPYPAWIKEVLLRSQFIVAIFPRYFARRYSGLILKLKGKPPDCYVLNGFFVALAPHLQNTAKVIGLSHGADLDIWANVAHADTLSESIHTRSFLKYLPKCLSRALVRMVVQRQFAGFAAADTVVYFPVGFSSMGDAVLKELANGSAQHVPRYDISFEVLKTLARRRSSKQDGVFRIFSGVRFTFRTFPEADPSIGKGNDIIIAGLAKYYHEHNQNIKIDFVEKGEDVGLAKALCASAGIDHVVNWHPEMPFHELTTFYESADVCFDQLGSHWIGQGMFSMSIGVPLIANVSRAVDCGLWPRVNPICHATNSDEVCNWLVRLEDNHFHHEVAERTLRFARAHFGVDSTLKRIFEFE